MMQILNSKKKKTIYAISLIGIIVSASVVAYFLINKDEPNNGDNDGDNDGEEQVNLPILQNGYIVKEDYMLGTYDDGLISLVFNNSNQIFRLAGISSDLGGYSSSPAFEDKSYITNENEILFTGKLPGHDVFFSQRITVENSSIKLEISRTGQFPLDVSKCDFSISLNNNYYKNQVFVADGNEDTFPEIEGAMAIRSDIEKLECSIDNPEYNLTLECEKPFEILDARAWDCPEFYIGFSLFEEENSHRTIYITLPNNPDYKDHQAIRFSQVGYLDSGIKQVFLEWDRGKTRPNDSVSIIKKLTGEIIKEGQFAGTIHFKQFDYAIFDFSEITDLGEYKIRWDGGDSTYFPINDGIFDDLWTDALDIFIPWQMCHANVDLGGYAPPHPASHLDDAIRVDLYYAGADGYQSYECEGTPYDAGDPIPCSIGGWYDAGDYDLATASQSHLVMMLALAYEEFAISRDVATLNITTQSFQTGLPDGKPDILQQIEWGVLFLLSMQQSDGRVYAGVVAQPQIYNSIVAPENSTNNIPGTGDERQVYVDYHTDIQLKFVVAMASASRSLQDLNVTLANQCLDAAEKAYSYYNTTDPVYRETGYSPSWGYTGANNTIVSALCELYLTTYNESYFTEIKSMQHIIEEFSGSQATYGINPQNTMAAPIFLARLSQVISDTQLNNTINNICNWAYSWPQYKLEQSPWPLQYDLYGGYGMSGVCTMPAFDIYYLSKYIPGSLETKDCLPYIYWLYGMHPLNDLVYVSTNDYDCPKYMYNGQLKARYGNGYGAEEAIVPGAVVPGICYTYDEYVTYIDDSFYSNYGEACTYTSAELIFALHCMKNL